MDTIIDETLFGFGEEMPDAPKVIAQIKQTVIMTPDKTAAKDDRRKMTAKEVRRIASQASPTDEGSKVHAKSSLKIEVLNGNGEAGLAKKAARVLKLGGFSVARFDNSGSFDYQKTLIVDWKGQLDKSLVLATFLNIQPDQVIVYDRPKKIIGYHSGFRKRLGSHSH